MPEILYHYTDANGLLGILRTGKLWLSHVAYLNDSQEWLYGGELVRKALGSVASDADERVAEFAKATLCRITDSPTDFDGMPRSYVASFSAAPDDLGQWRGYTKPGARYAIGFSFTALSQLAEKNQFFFSEVEYDIDRCLDRIASKFRQLIDEKGMLKDERIGMHYPHSIMQNLAGDLRESSGATCKHHTFSNEAEWRMCTGRRHGAQCEFRAGTSFIVPYVELCLKEAAMPIVSVTVGPTAHLAIAKHSVDRALAYLGSWNGNGQRVEVIETKIPYRDW